MNSHSGPGSSPHTTCLIKTHSSVVNHLLSLSGSQGWSAARIIPGDRPEWRRRQGSGERTDPSPSSPARFWRRKSVLQSVSPSIRPFRQSVTQSVLHAFFRVMRDRPGEQTQDRAGTCIIQMTPTPTLKATGDCVLCAKPRPNLSVLIHLVLTRYAAVSRRRV